MKKLIPLFSLLMLWGAFSYGQIDEIGRLRKQLNATSDSLRYVDILNRLATLQYERNVDSTFFYTQQARTIADRIHYAKGKADALNNLGIFYDMKGDLQLALRYYDEAYNRYRSLKDTQNRVQAMMNIAIVYHEIGKDQKSIINFKNAINLGRHLSRDSIMSLVYFNYLSFYPNNTPKDSLSFYIEKAKSIASRYKDSRVTLAIKQLTADSYLRNNERKKGISLLQEAAATAINSKLYYLSLDILIDLGDQFAATDSAQAVNYYKQGLQIAEAKRYRIYTEIFPKKLYEFYLARKDAAKAFYYGQKLIQQHDEQDKLDNNSGIDYIEYALKDQQLESVKVQSKDELWFLIMALLLCVFAIAVLIFLWRNWKKLHNTTGALRLQFEQSETTMEALEVMNKNYARLIKIVAHDLRNPVSAISSISGMLEPDEQLTEETRELVKLIQVSSKNSLDLINELLEADFDEQNKLKPEILNIGELLGQCVHLLTFRAKDKNQQLLLEHNPDINLFADREKLWRVINNLIVNAIKFSAEGSVIHIDCQASDGEVLITVKDSGVGIPADIQNKIFDPFTSAKRQGTHGEQAFGLGLYISKQIIEAHKGKIWLQSEPGVGSTFFVELPRLTDKKLDKKALVN